MKPRLVMKFGGTSVGTATALERTCAQVWAERRPALVVVSALGGVTDLLERALEQAATGGHWRPVLEQVEQLHTGLGAQLRLAVEPGKRLSPLRDLLRGVELVREVSPRVRDLVLSHGERASARLVAAALRQRHPGARAYDAWELGLVSDGHHGRAAPLAESVDSIRRRVAALPDDCLPVVTGFIARDDEGEVTTLGRGGSDYSAAWFGAALGVEEIQIWTDVAGFLRADPRVVEEPELLGEMTFAEAAELAYFGARVLHPRTIEPARRAGIDVRVLGTFQVKPGEAARAGTRISTQARPEPVRALALRRGVQSLHVHSLGMLDAPGFLARLFAVLARHRVSVDVVATSEVSVTMTFDSSGPGLRRAVDEIAGFASVEPAATRSLLCLVGAGLGSRPGLLRRVFGALAAAEIGAEVISQGASRINLTLVLGEEDGPRAMQVLYQELFGEAGQGG